MKLTCGQLEEALREAQDFLNDASTMLENARVTLSAIDLLLHETKADAILRESGFDPSKITAEIS